MKLIIVLSYIALQSFNATDVAGESISKKKCNHYRNEFPQLSEVFEAAPKGFPFMARIAGHDAYNNGILISEKFVVTVASSQFNAKYVILGDLHRRTRSDDTHSQYLGVIEEFIHPLFSSDSTFNFKLLMLNASVKFDEFVRPACLPQSESTIPQQLMEIGWSYTNVRTNDLSHQLRLNYISNKNVCKFIEHQKKLMEKIDNGSIFCATTNKGFRDICAGFGGAALLNRDQNSTLSEVIGLAISSTGCNEGYSTVFARISASLNWIESVVWPNEIAIEADTTTMSTTTMPTTTMPSTTTPTKITPTTTMPSTTTPTKITPTKITPTKITPTTITPTTITPTTTAPTTTISTTELSLSTTTTPATIAPTTTISTTTVSTTELPSSMNNSFSKKIVLSVIIILTILSFIFCVAAANFQKKRSKDNREVTLNITPLEITIPLL